jgi:uncharacterized protein YukE
MAEYILKYSAGVYQRKIDTLSSYYSTLQGHLETLNTFHTKMQDFWEGDNASKEMYDLIHEKILDVQKAMEDCNNLNLQYQKIVSEQMNTSNTIDSVVTDLKEATKQVVEVAGTAAKIAALI